MTQGWFRAWQEVEALDAGADVAPCTDEAWSSVLAAAGPVEGGCCSRGTSSSVGALCIRGMMQGLCLLLLVRTAARMARYNGLQRHDQQQEHICHRQNSVWAQVGSP
jgi:hypothetical protein